MARSVTASQPLPRWAAERPGCTVRQRLSSSTPRSVHGVRSPVEGVGCPRSLASSAKMLRRLGGSGRTSGATEKLSPTGWPGVG